MAEMTKREFLALPERQQCAIVHQHVMGVDLTGYEWSETGHSMCRITHSKAPCITVTWLDIPEYMRGPLAVKQVMVKMAATHHWTIRSPFEPGKPWTAGLTPHGITGWNGVPDHLATADDMEPAVSIAALLAIGYLREG